MHVLQVIHSRYILYEEFMLLNKVCYMQYLAKMSPRICANTDVKSATLQNKVQESEEILTGLELDEMKIVK